MTTLQRQMSLQEVLLRPNGNGDYRIHKNGKGVFLAQYKNIAGDWATCTECRTPQNCSFEQEVPVGGFHPGIAYDCIYQLLLSDAM